MVEPCTCPADGYCERHRAHKTAHMRHLCQTRADYRAAWDRMAASGATTVAPPPSDCQPCQRGLAAQPEAKTDTLANLVIDAIAAQTEEPDQPEPLILECGLSPGDIVVMTAAVRELHHQYPGQYITDVRTTTPEIWRHNPHITPIPDSAGARRIRCEYPLIHESDARPIHFVEGFCDHLGKTLGLPSLRPTAFHGWVYLADDEAKWINQVEEITGRKGPFWLVNAGGKYDYTCKWWPQSHYQAVIKALRHRVRFVQIGEACHEHPAIDGVVDLRGRTDHRQLIRLVYHAAGVLTPVSYPMHLAAAVPLPPWQKRLRPCVVVAGGREPVQWEAYPGHTFLHTIGQLSCCAYGGCWRSRVERRADESGQNKNLCEFPEERDGALHPRCMWRITPDDVVRAISGYLDMMD